MEKFKDTNKDEFGFKNGNYQCHSPAQREFLLLKGIIEDNEEIVPWTRKQRIQYLLKKGNKIEDIDIESIPEITERTRWNYHGSKELKNALIEWTKNNPANLSFKEKIRRNATLNSGKQLKF